MHIKSCIVPVSGQILDVCLTLTEPDGADFVFGQGKQRFWKIKFP